MPLPDGLDHDKLAEAALAILALTAFSSRHESRVLNGLDAQRRRPCFLWRRRPICCAPSGRSTDLIAASAPRSTAERTGVSGVPGRSRQPLAESLQCRSRSPGAHALRPRRGSRRASCQARRHVDGDLHGFPRIVAFVEDKLAETTCYAERSSAHTVFPVVKAPELLRAKWEVN